MRWSHPQKEILRQKSPPSGKWTEKGEEEIRVGLKHLFQIEINAQRLSCSETETAGSQSLLKWLMVPIWANLTGLAPHTHPFMHILKGRKLFHIYIYIFFTFRHFIKLSKPMVVFLFDCFSTQSTITLTCLWFDLSLIYCQSSSKFFDFFHPQTTNRAPWVRWWSEAFFLYSSFRW